MTLFDDVLKDYEAGFNAWLKDLDTRLGQMTDGTLTSGNFPRFDSEHAYYIGMTVQDAAEQCLRTNKTGRIFLGGR